MRLSKTVGTLAAMTIATVALSPLALSPASAASSGSSIGAVGIASKSGDELSARRRHYRYRHSGNAAAAQYGD